MSHTYKIKYRFEIFNEPNGYRESDMDFDQSIYGLTDQLMVTSILQYPDGSCSHAFVDMDSDKEPLSIHDLFMLWGSFTKRVLDDERLKTEQKKVLHDSFELMRAYVLNNKQKEVKGKYEN